MLTMSDLLTTAEVAEMLGLSVPTVNRRAASGEIPPKTKLPGKRGAHLFDRSVIELIARQQPAAQPDAVAS